MNTDAPNCSECGKPCLPDPSDYVQHEITRTPTGEIEACWMCLNPDCKRNGGKQPNEKAQARRADGVGTA